MSKVLKIAGASVVALALVLGLTLPALASPSWADDSQGKVVKGKVLSVGDQEFVIQSGEQELTISVDDNTKYYRMSMLGRIVASIQHRLQFRLQNQEELQAQAGDGEGSGLQNRVRERASARNQARLQNQISQTENAEDALQSGSLWLRCFCAFGGGAEFGDIAVGDMVVVRLADGDNLAQRVLIVTPTD